MLISFGVIFFLAPNTGHIYPPPLHIAHTKMWFMRQHSCNGFFVDLVHFGFHEVACAAKEFMLTNTK